MDQDTPSLHNLVDSLSEVLPEANELNEFGLGAENAYSVHHYAVPKGTEVKEFKVDLEFLLPNPRRTKAKAEFAERESFLEYIRRHATDASAVWCNFNPQTFALKFTAVFDEHVKDKAGWRSHKAQFEPDMSAEWKAWKGSDRKLFAQVAFAEWIQDHDDDISTAAGLPTSLQMLTMATDFQMQEEHALKSAVRLQSGGVRLTYIADPDKGTTEEMKMFERFGLGIPVFHGGPPWQITARLKYRNTNGKLSFVYELVRADRVHDGAAKELIEQVRGGLAAVPLLMGSCD